VTAHLIHATHHIATEVKYITPPSIIILPIISQYFNAQFSYGFPDEVMTVMMSLADQVPSHEGRLKKTDGPTRLLKILKCWGGFAEDHGLQEGHIYIMKFRVVGQVARLKVYPLPGPPAA